MNGTTIGGASDPLVTQGMRVYDVNGEKIGVVAELDAENDGFIVEEGRFLPKEVPVPRSAVATANAEGVYLTVSKEDAAAGNWHDEGTGVTSDQVKVDTQTPYRADAAESVGDRDLNLDQRA